jgi:hypothetical protein
MKKITLISLFSFFSLITFAQSEKYTNAMKKSIALLDSAFAKPDNFLSMANTFERIGTTEKTEWLPFYYAAYCRVNYAFMQKDPSGNDPIAEKATALLNTADSLKPNNSEISCLKSMIASVQMLVSPQQRFMQYGAASQKELQKAMQQDPANPRPYMLKGQSLKYTPEQFGGGCKNAMPQLAIAMEKFTSYKPVSEIYPSWGKNYTEDIIRQCK